MTEAFTYIYQIFQHFLDFTFNKMLIANGVSVGWVIVSLLIFGVLVRSILNLPRSMPTERGIRASRSFAASKHAENRGDRRYYMNRRLTRR